MKFKLGDSVSTLGSGKIPGYIVAWAPPMERFGILEYWYEVRFADGNEGQYPESELWLAV